MKEYRTNKVNTIFELTNSFKDDYNTKKKDKSQILNALDSCYVSETELFALLIK